MTETAAEFIADLHRQFLAFDDRRREIRAAFDSALAAVAHEEELIAVSIAVAERMVAMQPKDTEPERPAEQPPEADIYTQAAWQRDIARVGAALQAPQPAPPRQRQDVRGPVLALIRSSFPNEWTIEGVARELPALKAPSIRAALQWLAKAGHIRTNGSGLYWAWSEDAQEQASAPPSPEDAALAPSIPDDARAPPDDRQGGDSDRQPSPNPDWTADDEATAEQGAGQ